MNSDLYFKLMTLVLLAICAPSWANPGGDIGLDSNEKKSAEKTNQEIQQELEASLLSIDLSPLKKPKSDPLKYLYPYKRSITARTGIIMDSDRLSNSEFPLLIGAAYMLYRHKVPRYEVTANITTDSVALLGISKRHMLNEPNHFRGFWSYGVTLNVDPEQRFATVSSLDNYTVTGSFGMEDVTEMPKSVRLEVQFLVGTETQAAIFYVGSSWGLMKGN